MVTCVMSGTFISVQARGVLAIPPDVRRRFGLDRPGAQVELVEREDGVIELRPHWPMPIIVLDATDSAFVARLLIDPPEPSEKLRQAMEHHRRTIRPS
jgi:bifunctional DNA-binding transcriptional regulator/antitoxin component of YhaV-PrlF toxin-antitoxin module